MKSRKIIYLALIGGMIYLAYRQVQKNDKLLTTFFDFEKELALKEQEIKELKEKLKK
jgi:hypothetical protein